ncbi:MAG: hypothetical protein ACI9XU_002218, partial [Arenicella sp.]
WNDGIVFDCDVVDVEFILLVVIFTIPVINNIFNR